MHARRAFLKNSIATPQKGKSTVTWLHMDDCPYLTLGLASGCTYESVRDAYRSKAATLHPDAGGDPYRWQTTQWQLTQCWTEKDLEVALGGIPRQRAVACRTA